ncbi:hypothetical protein Cni_G20791 [Canna indica]|uniref:UVR domain-containing protein n=1 Tax=Canna indica TaxID=4628 RepID=A0AAQ3KNA3_9LILI|nr:hypothetical protein Cni_G20791 [Canna indica]
MASSSAVGEVGDDGAGSLFEGMVLFTPSSSSSIDLSIPQVDAWQPPAPDASTTPQPLDEDLFSDLTLQAPPSPPPVLDSPSPTPSSSSPLPLPPPTLGSRQPSRKKKRAVRIGYAREPTGSTAVSSEDLHSNKFSPTPSVTSAIGASTASKMPMADEPPTSAHDIDVGSDLHPDAAALVGDDLPSASPTKSLEQQTYESNSCEVVIKEDKDQRPLVEEQDNQQPLVEEQDNQQPLVEEQDKQVAFLPEESATRGDAFSSAEERLQLIRAQISEKLESVRQRAASAYAERKELERRRRKAVESVNSASTKHKDLEMELELACEAEDFERAERVSENLANVEEEKVKLLLSLRDAEADCESAESKMQEMLELQIAAEEEGITLLEQFAKEAADNAEAILKNAKEVSRKEQEEWQSSVELLEIKKLELDVESQLISEAHSRLENVIEDLVKNDREEKEALAGKGVVLAKELDELLQLVRLKEAEISENKSQIKNVETRISDAISRFNETQSSIGIKHENLQSAILKVESENESLLRKQKETEQGISSAEQMSGKLMELAAISSSEGKSCQDSVRLKKNLASFILKSREDRFRFSKTEEKILEDIHMLRQQISASRTALQELSSNRASIQQEVALYKQRIGFIEKRGPELEAEKKVAAAARNFKEAGRVAAEAKSLHIEKEDLQHKMEKAFSDLEKLEEEIKGNVDKIQENEELVALKEKEAASAGCNRLQLVAAVARAERLAALKMGDFEEGNILLKEAEAAESKVIELQKTYNLDMEVDGNNNAVSLEFITNLDEDHLTEVGSV